MAEPFPSFSPLFHSLYQRDPTTTTDRGITTTFVDQQEVTVVQDRYGGCHINIKKIPTGNSSLFSQEIVALTNIFKERAPCKSLWMNFSADLPLQEIGKLLPESFQNHNPDKSCLIYDKQSKPAQLRFWQWLKSEECTIPQGATHNIGAVGVVYDPVHRVILIVEKEKRKGAWNFPGGTYRNGDGGPTETAYRNISTQTHLRLPLDISKTNPALLGQMYFPPNPRAPAISQIWMFECPNISREGFAPNTDELSQVAWIDLEEAANLAGNRFNSIAGRHGPVIGAEIAGVAKSILAGRRCAIVARESWMVTQIAKSADDSLRIPTTAKTSSLPQRTIVPINFTPPSHLFATSVIDQRSEISFATKDNDTHCSISHVDTTEKIEEFSQIVKEQFLEFRNQNSHGLFWLHFDHSISFKKIAAIAPSEFTALDTPTAGLILNKKNEKFALSFWFKNPHHNIAPPVGATHNIGATALIVDTRSKKILLVQEAQRKWMWGFPGGSFDEDRDETPWHTAIRELGEETGYQLTIGTHLTPIFMGQMEFPNNQFAPAFNQIYLFPVEGWSDIAAQPREGEILKAQWFSLDEILSCHQTFVHNQQFQEPIIQANRAMKDVLEGVSKTFTMIEKDPEKFPNHLLTPEMRAAQQMFIELKKQLELHAGRSSDSASLDGLDIGAEVIHSSQAILQGTGCPQREDLGWKQTFLVDDINIR